MREKVCWQRDGAWQVGEVANLKFGDRKIVFGEFAFGNEQQAPSETAILIKHWPTGELELVDASLLRPYPFEEIPQP